MLCKPVINASLMGSFLLIGMFGGGCTINYELNTTPISKWPDHERVPASVDLVLSDQLRGYVFDKTDWGGDHLRFPIGNVAAINSRAMAEAAFSKVIVTDGKSSPPPGVNGILTPEMGLVDRSESAFAFDPVDMTADVKWTMSDPRGQVIWVKTVRGTAKHDLSNVFGHTAAAREHVDLVMQDLFTKSLKEITTAPEVRGPREDITPGLMDDKGQAQNTGDQIMKRKTNTFGYCHVDVLEKRVLLSAAVTDHSSSIRSAVSTDTVLADPIYTTVPLASAAQPTISFGAVNPASIVAGKSRSVVVTITNDGGGSGRGVVIMLGLSQDGITQLPGVVLNNFRNGASIAAGASKSFRLRFKMPGSVASGSYYLYASASLGGTSTTNTSDNPFLVTGNSRNVDFLTVTGFNAAGSTWNYNLTARSGARSARGTATTTVNQDSDTSWDWSTDISAPGNEAVDEDLTWEQTPTGVNLDSVTESSQTINFDNPQICGPLLSGKVVTSGPITIDTAEETDALSGTATLTTTLVGNAKVSVPAGTFSATEITLKIGFNADNYGDDGDGSDTIKVHGTDTQTFYAVNGVGLVRIVSSASEAESQSGQGTENVNTIITSDLTPGYTYISPSM